MHSSVLPFLEYLYRAFPTRSNPDILYSHTKELLNEFAVCLTLCGELFKGLAVGDVGVPAGEGGVLDLNLGEAIKVG